MWRQDRPQKTMTCPTSRSGDQVVDDVFVDVGEAEVAAGIAVRQLLVVEAKLVQNRGVEAKTPASA